MKRNLHCTHWLNCLTPAKAVHVCPRRKPCDKHGRGEWLRKMMTWSTLDTCLEIQASQTHKGCDHDRSRIGIWGIRVQGLWLELAEIDDFIGAARVASQHLQACMPHQVVLWQQGRRGWMSPHATRLSVGSNRRRKDAEVTGEAASLGHECCGDGYV